MPIHDWSTVDPNLFHHFHQAWSLAICNALNGGLLPDGFSALVEQHAPALVPDVLALEDDRDNAASSYGGGAVVTASRPQVRHTITLQRDSMAARANQITIRHSLGRIVCIIEIVSPGNKQSRSALRSFAEKAIEFLRNGVNLLVVDLFPPSKRDPDGIHRVIWDEFEETDFHLPADEPLTLAAYVAATPITAFVEPAAVGKIMPDMPAFLDAMHYVPIPLEATYQETWWTCPGSLRAIVSPNSESNGKRARG